MMHQPGESVTPEERALDEYLDALVLRSGQAEPIPVNELEKFAQYIRRIAISNPRDPQSEDPVLIRLKQEQQRRIQELAQNKTASSPNGATTVTQGLVISINGALGQPPPTDQEPATPRSQMDEPVSVAKPKMNRPVESSSSKLTTLARAASYLAVAVIAAIAGAIIYSAYNSWQGGNGVEGVPPGSSASQLGSIQPMASVNIDGVDIAVLGVNQLTEPIHTDLADEVAKRASFLIVQVALTNTTDEDATSSAFGKVLVQDQNGRLYAVDTFATLLENSDREYNEQFANLVLEPNVTHYVDLVFDVDSNSTEFALTEAIATDEDGALTKSPFLIPLPLP